MIRENICVTLKTEADHITETEVYTKTETARNEELLIPIILKLTHVRRCSRVVKAISCTNSREYVSAAHSLVIESADKAGEIHHNICAELSISERIDKLLRCYNSTLTLPSAKSETKAKCVMKLPLEIQCGSR